jgi:hypothetical protein
MGMRNRKRWPLQNPGKLRCIPLKYQPAVKLPRRRPRLGTLETLNRRNLHLGKDTWGRIAKAAQEGKYSVSVLTEYLLRRYLGLDISEDLKHG